MMCCGIFSSFAADVHEQGQEPDIEMLEYLGSWETENGEWLDPLQLFELAENSLSKEQEKRQSDE